MENHTGPQSSADGAVARRGALLDPQMGAGAIADPTMAGIGDRGFVVSPRNRIEADFWRKVRQRIAYIFDNQAPYEALDLDECWPWKAGKNAYGYGTCSVFGRPRLTHILAFEFAYGFVPAGLFVCHHCDNPPCCNPRHLYAGTAQDNANDRKERGRKPARRPPPSEEA